MKKNKNLIKKNIVKKSYKTICLLIALFSASGLWYYNVSPSWGSGYGGTLESYVTLFLVGVLFCVTYWFFAKMYQAQKIGIYRLTELSYFQLLSFGIADFILIVESGIWFHGIDKLNLKVYALVFAAQMVAMVFNIFVHNRLFARYDEARVVMVIYGNESYKAFVDKMTRKKYRYSVEGCYSDKTPFVELLGHIEKCESVYLYEADEELKRKLIFHCDHIGKDIYLTQDVDELLTMGFDISHTFDTPFIRTKRKPEEWYYAFVKRAIDILGSGIGLLVFSPVFLITAICIKLYDRGPVFYKQVRLTKNHKEFNIYKFRSMIINAEDGEARLASQHDNRITPIGKIIRALRVDELPQLINILKGDMTIVGPRPERPEIEQLYLEELPEFGLRLKVKAGLTGYAQVFGKYNTTPEDKLKLDLLYINQRSLFLDFKLIFYTIKIIFIPEATEGIDDKKTTAGKH